MEQNLNQASSKLYLYFVSFVVAFGGFLFGFDTAVISGVIPIIKDYLQLDEFMLGWTVGSVLIGCILGASVAGLLSDKFGRKRILLFTAILFLVSAIGCGFSGSVTELVVYRILGGVAVGAASMISPIYIAEISPAKIRGQMVSLNQLTIVIGILAAFFSNYFLLDLGESNWRWMFAAEAIPASLFFIFLFTVPESPRWLVQKGAESSASAILTKISGEDDAGAQLLAIKEHVATEHSSSFSMLLERKVIFLLTLGIGLAFFQQVTGINSILYYAPYIFEKIGLAKDTALLQTTAVGAVNVAFTFVAIWLIDKTGRKPLLLVGSFLMALFLCLIAGSFFLGKFEGYWPLIFILGYIASFAVSLGPATWVVIAEIFPNRIRGRAVSIATVALWASVFLLSMVFPTMLKVLDGGFTFLIFALFCLLNCLFVWWFIPETKGKSLEEIEESILS